MSMASRKYSFRRSESPAVAPSLRPRNPDGTEGWRASFANVTASWSVRENARRAHMLARVRPGAILRRDS